MDSRLQPGVRLSVRSHRIRGSSFDSELLEDLAERLREKIDDRQLSVGVGRATAVDLESMLKRDSGRGENSGRLD